MPISVFKTTIPLTFFNYFANYLSSLFHIYSFSSPQVLFSASLLSTKITILASLAIYNGSIPKNSHNPLTSFFIGILPYLFQGLFLKLVPFLSVLLQGHLLSHLSLREFYLKPCRISFTRELSGSTVTHKTCFKIKLISLAQNCKTMLTNTTIYQY